MAEVLAWATFLIVAAGAAVSLVWWAMSRPRVTATARLDMNLPIPDVDIVVQHQGGRTVRLESVCLEPGHRPIAEWDTDYYGERPPVGVQAFGYVMVRARVPYLAELSRDAVRGHVHLVDGRWPFREIRFDLPLAVREKLYG
jgi:hypothetical protein